MQVKANFSLSDIGMEYLDEDGDLISVATEGMAFVMQIYL